MMWSRPPAWTRRPWAPEAKWWPSLLRQTAWVETSIKRQEQPRYVVRTFNGLVLHALPSAVKQLEGSVAFDVAWPDNEELQRLGGQDVVGQLVQKSFCLVQCFLAFGVASECLALSQKRSGFKRLVKELEPCYLGRSPQGKVDWLAADDPRREVQTALESCDRLLSRLASGLYLECQESLGFLPEGRSDALLRLPCRTRAEEEDLLRRQEVLTEEHVNDGKVEDHIEFIQSRKLCSILQVAGSAKVVLHRADEVDVSLVLQSSQILVFRHDQLSFTYEGSKDSLAMQSWLFSTGFTAEVQAAAGNLGQMADIAEGVMSGPLSPINPLTGKTVSIMAVDCMLAGRNGVSPEQMYWSMLSVGTDGCRHLSSSRWDTEAYFEADKDRHGTGS
ncbi:unnamed protein product [Effrenium voratum]|nr:unnamed protein product [Effrenium voratum]